MARKGSAGSPAPKPGTRAKAAPARPAPAKSAPAPAKDPLDDLHKEVLEEKQKVTSRISETTRQLGFGLLAAFYAIISSADAFPQKLEASYPLGLKIMALCGSIAMLLDYLQYVFGARAVQNALDRTDKPFRYKKTWISYRARRVCYLGKQLFVLIGCLIFVWVIVRNL